jgi:hypothetical protein
MPGKRAKRARKRVERSGEQAASQVRGTADRAGSILGGTTVDEILPPAAVSTISWILALVPKALGFGTAREQVIASVSLIIPAVISTPITLGYSLLLAIPPSITLVIGLWRLVPAVNDRFMSARGNRSGDIDVPLWGRD